MHSFFHSFIYSYLILPECSDRQTNDTCINQITKQMKVIFMVAELILTGGSIPICIGHAAFAVLFGVVYVLFSWYWFMVSGIFFYFFLDYRRRWAAVMQLGLVIALIIFYIGTLAASRAILSYPPWVAHPTIIAVSCAMLWWRRPLRQGKERKER